MNLEAERGTLAALITLPDFGHTLPFKLAIEDFRGVTNRVIAECVLAIIDNGQIPNKNLITSTAKDLAIDSFDELTKSGSEIDAIIALHPNSEEAIHYVRHLKKESIKHIAKDKFKALHEYINTTDEPLADIITTLEDTMLTLTSSADFSENQTIKLGDIIDEELAFCGDNPGKKGLDIGYPLWQERVGGIANGLVHMVIATNKTGKSNFGMNAAIEASRHFPVLYIDTEMTSSILTLRMFSNLIRVPTKTIEDGFWSDPEHDHHMFWHRIQQGTKDFKNLDITYVHAGGKQVVDMIPTMRKWCIQNKTTADGKFPQGLIIFDYLKLATSDSIRNVQEYQLLGLQASALKDFCNKYKIPCITFGQTNREDDNSINCLGASKRLADLVDSITLFKEKDEELLTKDPHGSHLLRVFIARHGPGTSFDEHIQMQYDKDTGQIGELGHFQFKPRDAEWEKKKFKRAKRAGASKDDEPTLQDVLETSLGPNNDE